MEAEGEDPATGNFDHEGRNRRRRNNKNRRKYFYVIFLIALVLLIIVGIILALTLTRTSSHSDIVEPVIQFLTISWFNIATTKFRIKRDSLETDDPRTHINNSLNSDQWKQMIDQEKNLQIRFLPYTDQAGNASNYYTSSTEAISALTNISPVSFSGTPSQENLADSYISYLKQQQNAAQQILMLFAPPITAYPNGYQDDAKITGSKLSTVILTMDKIVVIAQSWNQTDVNVYNLTESNVDKIYGDQDIDGKIIGSIGTNQTSTTTISTTTIPVTHPTSPSTSPTTVQVSSSSSTLPITSPTTTTTQAIPVTTTTTTTTQVVPVTTPTTTTTRVIPVTTPTTTTEVPVTTKTTITLQTTTESTSTSSIPTSTMATTPLSTASINAASSSTSTTTVSSSSTTFPSTISSTTTVVTSSSTSTVQTATSSRSSTSSSPTTPITSTSSISTNSISSSTTPEISTPTSRESSIASTLPSSSVPTPSTTATASTNTVSNTLSASSSTSSGSTSSPITFTSSISTESTSESTSTSTSIPITTIPVQVCRSYIPFSFDISLKLNSVQFADLKTFLVNPFLESLFPTNVQPLWYSTYANANFAPRSRPSNVSDIINYVQTQANQGTAATSDFSIPLNYFVGKNVMNIGENDGLNVNTIVFAADSLTNDELSVAQDSAQYLTQNGNTLTVVLMNPNIDTNYQQIRGLNIIFWNDTATTIAAIRNVMNCGPQSSTAAATTTTASTPSTSSESGSSTTVISSSVTTPVSTSEILSTSTVFSTVTPSTSTGSEATSGSTSSPITVSSSASMSTMTFSPTTSGTTISTESTSESTSTSTSILTTTIPVQICRSYIPFSFDISLKLNSAQFADLKTFLVNPFLESIFPEEIRPLWYSTYANANFAPRSRPSNVSDIINYVQTQANQGTAATSDFSIPLNYFVGKNVTNIGETDGLIVNTVVFAGDSLALADIATVQNYASVLIANRNTLTVVLMNPNIDTNYRQITGLNIVVWSDTATTITAIRNVMICPTGSSSTVPTTSGSTTPTTSTLLPSSSTTTETISSSVPSSPLPSSTTTGPTSSISTSETVSVTISSQTSTSPISSSSTTGSSTSPSSTTLSSTENTPTSTQTTTIISTSTTAISSTTTIPVPVCKSYIPFSFDVSTDLTPTEFAELKTFLVNPFLESVFSQDVQPAWYSTYDSTNYNYTRPTNVADVINGVQSSIQSAVTTSDSIQPLQYLVEQGVADLGSTDGLAINSIIFAGSPLTDVDTASFYATTLTSNGNTLTVVLMNPNIDTNYRQVPRLNIVVWSDPATTIDAIRNVMNCEALPSTSTITTTTGMTTTSSLTLPPSTTETTTSVTTTTRLRSTSTPTSTIGSSTESPGVTTSTVPSSPSTTSGIPSSTSEASTPTSSASSSTSTVTSSPITTPSTTESTSMMSTTITIPVPICKSYIPFSFDVAVDLTPTQFADLKAFLVNPFLESVFPKDVQPAWYTTYDNTSHNNIRPTNVSEIIRAIPSVIQTAVVSSLFNQPLLDFIAKNVMNLGSDDGLFVNTIIFAGSPLSDADLGNAQDNGAILTRNGNTLTVVLVNPNINQTNYRQVTGLNIVIWSDPVTTIANILNVMNCPNFSSTGSSTTTTGTTSISSSASTSTFTVTTPTISSSTAAESPTPSISTTVSSTTPEESTTTTPIPAYICRSYIPFSFDVSTKLTTDQFTSMKTFLLHPFLDSVFPVDFQPAWFSTYSDQNYPNRRPANVSAMISFVTGVVQGTSVNSLITLPLKYFVDQNVTNLATTELAVNTVIFAGNSLASTDIPIIQNYTTILTANGNTLTVVLMNPNIDQTNYQQITGLNIVVWNESAITIAAIESHMNCGPTSPTSSATATTGMTTTSTSTLSPSTSETTTPVTTSTVSSTSIESTITTSTVVTTTSLSSSSSTSTTPGISSSTPEASTSTSNVSSSTSTVISSPITTPSTTESTSMMSTTTTIPVPVCKSYIPFSFDVSRDLTSTQFADLTAFLVNPFLESIFSQDVQPAWYSTYDSANYNYTRPGNVADVIIAVQSSVQSVVTTSDFIQPLEYLVNQGVADLGSTDGLAVNSIIFAGSPLTDVDTASFYATTLTSNGNTLTVVLMNPNIDTNYRQIPGLNIVVWSDSATTVNAIRNVMNCEPLPSTSTVTTTTGMTTTSTSTLPPSTSETTTVVTTTEPFSTTTSTLPPTTTVFESTSIFVSTTTISSPAPSSTSTPEPSSVSTSTETSSSSTTTLSISSTVSSSLPPSSPTTTTETTTILTTTGPTTTLGPTTSTTTTQPTTTHTYPRPIDIAVILDGSVCSNGGNLGEQLIILEKIFSEYTFGTNVRVAFAYPINMRVEFTTRFVCDMDSINSTIRSINEFCGVNAFLNPEQRLNDSMLGAMNVLYNQNSPALTFIVLLQSNGSTFANETTSVVNSAKYIRQNCLEPTNATVVVVQVDSSLVVDPELASDGFFFTNTEDIGHLIGEALEYVADYNAAAYTCAPTTFKDLIPDPKDSSGCYANP